LNPDSAFGRGRRRRARRSTVTGSRRMRAVPTVPDGRSAHLIAVADRKSAAARAAAPCRTRARPHL